MNAADTPSERAARPEESLSPLSRAAIIAVAAYVAVQLVADIGSTKIGRLGGWPVDLGTWVFPIGFTLRDVAHKVLGRRGARVLILAGAAMNLAMAGFMALFVRLPAHATCTLSEPFAAVLAPVPRIVLASILAQVAGQMVNTEVYHWFRSRITRRHQWLRVLLSNMAAIPVDSVVFVLAAFAGRYPASAVAGILGVNLALKLAVSLAGIPLIYTVRHVDRD